MLGNTKSDIKYRKRNKNVRDVETFKKLLADAGIAALGTQHEVPTASENVEIHAPKKYHSLIHALLPIIQDPWFGQLGHINSTTPSIDLIP